MHIHPHAVLQVCIEPHPLMWLMDISVINTLFIRVRSYNTSIVYYKAQHLRLILGVSAGVMQP